MTRRQMASSTPPSTSASVNAMVINVAMFGSIIPTPLATPTTRAGPEPIVASAILCTVSVVMMPRATETASLLGNGNGNDTNPVRTFSMGYWRPMTPVDAINTSCGSQPSFLATPCTTSRALARPCSPVATLAFFEMTTTARAEWLAMCLRETTTLGPANRLCVKTPAAATTVSAATTVKSSLVSLIPMLVTKLVNPWGSAVMLTPSFCGERR